MGEPITSIRNLGPKTAEAFKRAGIGDAETLRALGPDEGYKRLLLAGGTPHFAMFWALVLGLQGRPWNDISSTEKKALRKRFNAVKRSLREAEKRRKAKAPTDGLSDEEARLKLEAALDRLGVRAVAGD
ncbi:MAG: competence protein TfoX [Rhodobacteraceae bacterium]|nr:competence protein TfoX [Paracoccaceae bacterium]MBR27112.1 competence protein TfoX [Paracoccaceae bacterium]